MYVYHQQEKIPLPIAPYMPEGDIPSPSLEQPKTQKKIPKTQKKIIRKRCGPVQKEQRYDYTRMVMYGLIATVIVYILYEGMRKKQNN